MGCFARGLPYKVRNFLADFVSVWEVERRLVLADQFTAL
jgi:hypothetical protein